MLWLWGSSLSPTSVRGRAQADRNEKKQRKTKRQSNGDGEHPHRGDALWLLCGFEGRRCSQATTTSRKIVREFRDGCQLLPTVNTVSVATLPGSRVCVP